MRAQILRCAQDDTTPGCHPERSEGSSVDLWVITRTEIAVKIGRVCVIIVEILFLDGYGQVRCVGYV